MSCGENCKCGEKKIEVKEAPVTPIMQYFAWGHLPFGHLQDISRKVAELAIAMEQALPAGPEKTTGLRKLLEAKDCFMRVAMQLEKKA